MIVAVQFILALMGGAPWPLKYWLIGLGAQPEIAPRYVVVLGGGGIPSESGLIRTYWAAAYGITLTNATFIVSLPAEESVVPGKTSVELMRDELIMRGIPANSILMETKGKNTYQQARNIRRMLGDAALNEQIVVVTSGFHMRRSILCFRKQGFKHVGAEFAEGIGAEADPGPFAFWRYTFWHNLEREASMIRELIAMVGYKLLGWI